MTGSTWQAKLVLSSGARHALEFDDEASARDFWKQWCDYKCGRGPRNDPTRPDPLFGGDAWAIDLREIDAVFVMPTPDPRWQVCLPCYAMMALAAVGVGFIIKTLLGR